MSTRRLEERIPDRYRVTVLVVLLVSFAYALLLGDLSSWLWALVGSISLVASLLFLCLFYRLVLAVERISYEL